MSIAAVSKATLPDQVMVAQVKASKADTSSKAARPTPPPGAGAPPPPPAAKPSAASSVPTNSAKIYDKRDANKDGKVSAQEMIRYAMKHPATASPAQATSSQAVNAAVQQQSEVNYDQKGKLSDNTNLLKGNIDTSA